MLRLLLGLLIGPACMAQGYTSYFTGNPVDAQTDPDFGICLMGGATEHDNAMIWLLERAQGGDVVVLRSSGSDGYNDYLYSELGVSVNSVETLVITSVAGATNPYVLDKVSKAELIWFAGGDQWNYVSFFKDNALEDLLNDHINIKQSPIGGTSAGMAILGEYYFSAQNGSVTSNQALSDPFHPNVTLGSSDFLSVPWLEKTITDSHYDDPDRRGRHSVFIARLGELTGQTAKGMAVNEYVAICVDESGKASVFGDYPNYEEFAYFVAPVCDNDLAPEVLQAGMPLTWENESSGGALKAYKVPGTMTGEHYFDLSDWWGDNVSGGWWENWSVANGVLQIQTSQAADCSLDVSTAAAIQNLVYPNPFSDWLYISGNLPDSISIFNSQGRKIMESQRVSQMCTSHLVSGLYLLQITRNGKTEATKLIKP